MADNDLKKECRQLIKRLKKEKSGRIYENAYYLIPALKSAAEALSHGADAELCRAFERRLELLDWRADEYELCAFLRKNGASDRDVRRIGAYLTYIYCRQLIGGRDVLSRMREADRLDFSKIISECSPLEKRLCMYRDYAESDEKTKAEYRRRLRLLARKKGVSALELLNSIPYHKFTFLLLSKTNHGALHAVILLCSTLFLCSLLYLLTTDFAAVFLCVLPLYRLAEGFADRLLFHLLQPYAAARVSENTPLPGCLITVTSLLDDGAEKLCERLEQMYFTEGKSGEIYFGILADLCDGKTKYKPEDDPLIAKAEACINALNERHGQRFFLFVRERKYSMSEGCFIAPDRKRGAVCELVRQLETGVSSLRIYGADSVFLSNIPYIITLDSDTLLYPGSSASLLRCAIHPANKAVVDEKNRVVIRGHGIFQPRIKPRLKNGFDTPFSRVYSADSGIDTYQGFDFDTVSAAYGRGVFCGKGLIDVSAFYKCCVDYYPTERILSHDGLEGARLRCCAVTDTVMYENTPKNALSYFKRLDRWIRGDIQALPFLKKYVKNDRGIKQKNGIGNTDRILLFNNVIHDVTPVFSVLCVLYGLISGSLPVLTFFALGYVVIPPVLSIVFSHKNDVKSDGVIRVIMQLCFLFHEATVSLFAVCKAFIRIFTHRHTLKWMTASASDKMKTGGRAFFAAFLPSVTAGVTLMITSNGTAILTGALFALAPLTAYLSAFPPKKKEYGAADRAFLRSACADHMKYFDDLVNAEHNYLPPDNFQVLCGVGAAPRTSPTNIGLYLLSAVAAVDIGLHSANSLYDRLYPTLLTLQNIPKKDGLLYNWYDTRTLSILSDLVSTVDCGNYLCALITLRQALYEYAKKDGRLKDLIGIANSLIDECDLSRLYDKGSGLFYIGDSGTGKYDMYESEMHTTDIAAVAYGFAPASHLCRLSRPVIKQGDSRGIASWSGTCFEYFMPALFLPAPAGSLCGQALKYAAYQQKKDVVLFDGIKVHGRSESCYYGFDRDMNYQYKAHGVNALSLCADTKEQVISPYSLFLMLGYDKSAEKTLKALRSRGCYGKYGFFEAVDLTRSRVGGGCAVIKCFMAHHIGMSVIAAANRICGGVFVKRFCGDARIASALPLLYEKFPDTRAVSFKVKHENETERYEVLQSDRDCALLTNTVCTAIADNYGAGLYYKNVCICDAAAKGIRGLSLLIRSGGVFDLLKHPTSFSDGEIKYGYKDRFAALTVCKTSAAFRLEVRADGGSALCFEPVLAELLSHRRHTAYSSLFIVSETEGGIIRFIRRGKGAFCISVCAYNGGLVPLCAYTKADELHGYKTLGTLFNSDPKTNYGACVFPRLFAKTDADGVIYYIGAGRSRSDSDNALFSALNEDKNAAGAVLPPVDSDVFCKVLRCIMRPLPKISASHINGSYRSVLYRHGISGDFPVILLDFTGEDGVSQLRSVFPAYAQTVVRLLIGGINADTVILYGDDDGYYNKKKNEITRIAGACGLSALIGTRLFIVCDTGEEKQVLSDICVYGVTKDDKRGSPSYTPRKIKCEPKRAVSDTPPFFEGDCAVLPSGATYSPMSFIYANPCFGALVTDRSGGFCWYLNSRMMALTAHDTVPEGPAEKLYFLREGKRFELYSHSSECRFYPSYAKWKGEADGAPYTVTVCVDSRMPYKVVTVDIACDGVLVLDEQPVIAPQYVNGSLRCGTGADTVYITNALEPAPLSFFVHCADSASEFDGKTLSVKARHFGKTVFTVGAVSSHTALEYILSSKDGAEKRYRERIEKYLSPFSLHSTDGALDLFFNLYARYQALFCRQFARCGPSQNGGAFGFRDQLQDCLCTGYGDPLYACAVILRCASHQYEEGDVMHWFHPFTDAGIRSRCSDDMLWLPYVVYKYTILTNDTDILDIKVRYLFSPPLDKGERDRYEKAVYSEKTGTLFEHCVKALGCVKTGDHGLCLMGGGDWNDGMNEAGIKGKGESVWLTMFSALVFNSFAYLCGIKNLDGEPYKRRAAELLAAVEAHGYDGQHYIRGYLDSGKPFGKTGDKACEIDILPQAFAALCGLDRERVKSSLDCVYDKLYDKNSGMIKLFSPPFDGEENIGYITSYPKGIRENGGQYTHGAIWASGAFSAAGQGHRGYELLKAINPVNRCRDMSGFIKYGREPYALCGDVYTAEGLYGRGGWPWYSGSAGWYFTTALERLLGYREHDGGFEISPCLCSEFFRFTLTVRRHGTEYVITAQNTKKETLLDGKITKNTFFYFDKGSHTLDIGAKR